MGTLTSRLALHKPADDGSEAVNVATDLNANWDVIDENIGITRCLSTDHPADPYDGMPIKEDDTGLVKIWNADASTWDTVTVPPDVATSTTRPASPITGDDLFETDTAAKVVYTGSTWKYVGGPLVVTSSAAVTTTKYPGLEIYETNTGHKKLWDGSAWQYTYFKPTAWTNLSLAANVIANTSFVGYTPAYRQVSPDRMEMRGVVGRSSGNFSSGDTIATLPASPAIARPAAQPNYVGAANAVSSKGYMVRLEVNPTSGAVIVRFTTLTFGTSDLTWFSLDGWIYDLT